MADPQIATGPVTLTGKQADTARNVGRLRNRRCKAMGLGDTYGLPVTGEDNTPDRYDFVGLESGQLT